jgi:hypothetical protein
MNWCGIDAATDVGKRLQHQLAVGHEFLHALLSGLALGVLHLGPAGREQVGQVVKDRLHPRGEFLVLVAGEIADVATHGHDRAGDEQLS